MKSPLHTDLIINQLSIEFGLRCNYCGTLLERKFVVDHVIPLYQGGTDIISNLRLCCNSCNIRKASMSLERFRRKDWFLNNLGIRLINVRNSENPSIYASAIEKLEKYTGKKFDYSSHKFYFEK